ncbi:MAG: putative xanthine dehydrogenase YagT iron-sulfur-binding subunit [Ilumatobacteraceae bacterium]|nr:putative xanthine dehydrogenase YagT iron-sulfur-binding subunit [Ilumatobacteraceae bacterium]
MRAWSADRVNVDGDPTRAATRDLQPVSAPSNATRHRGSPGGTRGIARAISDDGVTNFHSTIDVSVNGQRRSDEVDHRSTLLDYLREHLGLTGSKKGCDHGQCGACTVLQDGLRINSCLQLAVMADGTEVITIEGIDAEGIDAEGIHTEGIDGTVDRAGSGGGGASLQRTFVELDGLQCGYCTPGQICSAVGVIREIAAGWPSAVMEQVTDRPALTEAEVRERMSGNLCRCGAYVNIVPAILRAQELRS